MSDKIFLEDLEIRCIIGTLPRERRRKQKVVIDLEFPAPVREAARRDDLRKAVDYQKIAKRVTEFVSRSRFYLIETLADRLASLLLREFPLKSLLLRVSKPGAIRNAKNVGVRLERKRKNQRAKAAYLA
jgi:dihydroneopterin aldolase